MKKTFLLVFLLLISGTIVRADVVSQEKARIIAERFLHIDRTRAGDGLTLLWDGTDAQTRAGEAPLFYIYTKPGGGWVMVSGEDAIEPIIGYSYHDNFEVKDMPENLQEYFALLKSDIRAARASGKKGNAAEWAEAMVETRANDTIKSAVLLNTAKFNQGNPWNLKCPMIDGKHALAGCCAIAFAIIMEYHQYPKSGTGTLPGYTTEKYTAPSITLGHTYDWDNIKKTYKSGQYNDKEADAVSTLVRDVAIMGRSSFGLSGTGSTMSAVCNRARTYFKYSKGAHRLTHSQYSDEEWFQMLKKDLDEGLPINYASNTHSYVCDGYDVRGYVHFNYGWGGSDNGYYNIAGKTAYGCCVGLRPDPEIQATSYHIYLSTSSSGKGISKTDTRAIVKGTPFNINVGSINNLGFDTFSFDWVVAHVDKNGKVKEYVTDIYSNTLDYTDYTTYPSVPCNINEDIYVGDRLKAFYRPKGRTDVEWIPMDYLRYTDGFTGEFPLTGDPLETMTSMEYDRALKRFIITTDKNAQFSLLDANGTALSVEYINGRYGTIYIYADKLPAGEYTIVLSSKYYVDVKNIKIRVK